VGGEALQFPSPNPCQLSRCPVFGYTHVRSVQEWGQHACSITTARSHDHPCSVPALLYATAGPCVRASCGGLDGSEYRLLHTHEV
jgi:hypothetical protein